MAQLLGTLPMVAVAVGVTPLISQIPTLPLVSRQRMSDMPSPLKSPVSAMLQAAGTLPMPEVEATAVPLRSQIPTLPLVSRQKQVALAVTVEVAGSDNRPAGRHIGDHRG